MWFSKSVLFSLIVFTMTPNYSFGGSENVETESHFLEPITDPAALSGKKFWLKDEPDEGKYIWSDDRKSHTYMQPKQTIYFVTAWEENKAWVKIDGKMLELSLVESKGVPKKGREKEGDKFTRIFSAEGITASVEYMIESLAKADDCIRTTCEVNLIVSKGMQRDVRAVRNVWGC